MKHSIAPLTLSATLLFLFSSCTASETPAPSADLMLVNAHVIDGTGKV
jgi:hypothetical protein